jgi:hypothetical protein
MVGINKEFASLLKLFSRFIKSGEIKEVAGELNNQQNDKYLCKFAVKMIVSSFKIIVYKKITIF